MVRRAIIGFALALAVGGICRGGWADLIELQDGRTVDGTLVRKGESVVITGEDGVAIRVKPSDIVKVTLTSTVTPAQASDAEWIRAAAAIRQADDLQTIIGLHQKFLDKYPDQNVSESVRTSLAEYQKLAEQHGVKFRGKWMPEAQVQVTMQNWADAARPALGLYRAGNLRGALDAAKTSLKADGVNPDAFTIAGLASYRLNMTGESRDYFITLTQNDPSNVLGENNLAVILFGQKRQAEGLIHYGKALQASPDNRFVADNIEEALNAYSGDVKAVVFQDLVRQFRQAESRIEVQMARRGLYRYGSTWVPAAVLDRLNANLQAIKNAMSQLDSQYQAARNATAALDQQIAQVANDYNTTALNVSYLNSLLASTTGDVGSLIAQRDDLERTLQGLSDKKAALEAQRQNAAASLQVAPDQADRLKGAYAAAMSNQFTGVQRMMDWGEADNPPPPTIVQVPSPVPIALPTPQPAPVPVPDRYQRALTDSYQQAGTPLGVVPVPVFINSGGHGGHNGDGHDGGHHGDGGRGNSQQFVPIGPVMTPVAPRVNLVPPTFTGRVATSQPG